MRNVKEKSHDNPPDAQLTTVTTFQAHFFVENPAGRADGSILVSVLNRKQLWYVPAPDRGPPVTPAQVHTFDGFAMGIVEAEPDSFYTENTIGCMSIESATENATRSVVAGDPFDGQLVGPSSAAWARGSAHYRRVAYVTTNGSHTAVEYDRLGTDRIICPVGPAGATCPRCHRVTADPSDSARPADRAGLLALIRL
jgi:hypothetical protein